MTARAILRDEPVSMPVLEPDGARSGFRTRPAPCDGIEIGQGEDARFVPLNDLESAISELKMIRRNAGRRKR